MAINFPDNRDQLVPPQPSGDIQTGDVYVYQGTTYTATVLGDGSVRWDAAVSAGSDAYVLKVGDTMTGQLTLPGGGTGNEAATVNQIPVVPAALWQRDANTSTLSPVTADDNINQGAGDITTTGDLSAADGTFTGDVSAASFTTTGDVQTTSLNGGQLAGFRNQIINGDFRIWQRGAAGFESTTNQLLYGSADRWGLRNTPAGSPSLGRGANGPAGFLYNASLAANSVARQRVELFDQHPAPFLDGTTWTLSIWTNNDVIPDMRLISQNGVDLIPVGPATATGESSNGFKRYSLTATIGAMGANNDFVEVWVRNNSGNPAIKFTGVQLEPGPVATPFEHRPIGTELALCQRYYQRLDGCSYTFDWTGTSSTDVQVPLKVTMRGVPSLSVDNVTGLIGTSPTIGGATADMARISAGATAENKRARFRLSADAEL